MCETNIKFNAILICTGMVEENAWVNAKVFFIDRTRQPGSASPGKLRQG